MCGDARNKDAQRAYPNELTYRRNSSYPHAPEPKCYCRYSMSVITFSL